MMKPDFFDIHSHIQFLEFKADQKAVIERFTSKNIWTITVGTDALSSREGVKLAEKTEGVFASIGMHPTDNTTETFDEAFYSTLVSHPKTVAVGECGLDYYRAKDNSEEERARQRKIFESHITFALKYDKPLMIHCRDAYEDILSILEVYKKEAGGRLRGNVHFFAGNIDIAKRFVSLDFTCSFTGVLTFTHDYDSVVAYLPLTHILSETDCPFVAPIPFRGKRNEPLYVTYVVERIAEIKNIPVGQVKKTLVENASRVFLAAL